MERNSNKQRRFLEKKEEEKKDFPISYDVGPSSLDHQDFVISDGHSPSVPSPTLSKATNYCPASLHYYS